MMRCEYRFFSRVVRLWIFKKKMYLKIRFVDLGNILRSRQIFEKNLSEMTSKRSLWPTKLCFSSKVMFWSKPSYALRFFAGMFFCKNLSAAQKNFKVKKINNLFLEVPPFEWCFASVSK